MTGGEFWTVMLAMGAGALLVIVGVILGACL